ncbi:MAG: ATP-binding protein [Bdellovibrionia bacterium]
MNEFVDYKTIFEFIPESYIILKPDHTIFAVTNDYLKTAKTKRDQIIGRRLSEVFSDTKIPLSERCRAQSPIVNEAGEVLFTVYKVDEQVNDEQFRMLANLMPQLAWIAHGDGFIYWYNEGWYKYTGATAKQLEGWGWQSFHDSKELPRVLEKWKEAILYGKFFEMEFPLLGADGQFRWFLTRVSPVKNIEGIVVRWLGTNTDIDDQRHAKKLLEDKVLERTNDLTNLNSVLESKVAQLAASNSELEDFAYVASHDLKEPLRGIGNYATFLLEDYSEKLDEAGKKKLEALPRLVKHLEGLIDGLLYYSRVGRVNLAVKETNLSKVVLDVVDSLSISLEEQRVEVSIPKPLPKIVCDQVRVGEVFRNLIINAMKFNDKAAKKIEIGFVEKDPPIFYVRDNGIGIQPDHIHSLFRIFKRLNRREKFGNGTGLGLMVAKRIVERHGGHIWVESTFGQNTTFYFTFEGSKQLD